jgi:hypothetical protein
LAELQVHDSGAILAIDGSERSPHQDICVSILVYVSGSGDGGGKVVIGCPIDDKLPGRVSQVNVRPAINDRRQHRGEQRKKQQQKRSLYGVPSMALFPRFVSLCGICRRCAEVAEF